MKGAGRCLHTVTVFKELKQRRFWTKYVNRKWTFSFLVFLDATKFVLLDDLPKSVLKITAQECKKSTYGWRTSLKNVAG